MAITAKQAIEAIKGSRGFITTVANRLGCSRMNVYLLMKKYPTVKQAILDEKDEMKDFAEAQLFQNIKDGKETSLIFYLKTQAKDRGYIERQEITGKDGESLLADWLKDLKDSG